MRKAASALLVPYLALYFLLIVGAGAWPMDAVLARRLMNRQTECHISEFAGA